jgi:asparagine synthase (glutamine-hydrolysing)
LLWPDERIPNLFENYTSNTGPVWCYVNKPYSSYPLHHFSVNGVQVVLEGIIYNQHMAVVEKSISHQLSGDTSATALQLLTASWSGEWYLWVQNGSELIIINDPLGRLPVYYYSTNNHFYIGRHLGVLANAGLLQPCPKAAASFLWSSYYIGHRTPYQQVFRLAGGSVVQVNLHTGESLFTFGKSLNFDARSNKPLQQTADELAELFKQACAQMATAWPGHINISLSGGQDSRAVASALAAAQPKLDPLKQLFASSFTMHGAEKDATLAATIAAQLHIPFNEFSIEDLPEDEDVLLQNKMGMNYVGMAFIHSFYRKMLQKYPAPFLYVTGDGGDKALPYLGETKHNLSLDELVNQLSMRHAMTPVEKVALLTGMAVNDILQLIYEVVRCYPEAEMNNRSIHFTIYERAAQSFFEGEDRSRYFFWATTPFYDLNFFKAAMLVPDHYKKHYRIYRLFQNALNRQIADIPDASGHSINNWKFVLRKGVQEAFRSAPPSLKNLVRKMGGKSISINQSSITEQQALLTQLQSSPALLQTLDANAVQKFLPTANQEQYLHLRTLILLDKFYKR